MNMWIEEQKRELRRREWRAFYLGVLVATGMIMFGAFWFVQLTKGETSCYIRQTTAQT